MWTCHRHITAADPSHFGKIVPFWAEKLYKGFGGSPAGEQFMLDRNQLKAQGIRYARSLQMLFKTIAVFSADHRAAAQPFQQSFDVLNALLKQTGQFTIGFVDQRIMLNNILTTEKALNALENEFLKRGIGAITFQAGLTLAAYRRGVGLLARSAKEIEAAGGLGSYLDQEPLEFMRVLPTDKSQKRTESGDTILDMEGESYLLAKTLSDSRSSATTALEGFEALLRSSGGSTGAGGPGAGSGEGGGPGGYGGAGGGYGAEGSGLPGVPWTGIGGPRRVEGRGYQVQGRVAETPPE